jgi:glucose/arabinose dehydrogenase
MKKLQVFIPAFFMAILLIGCSKKSESQHYIGSTAIDTATIISGLDTPWEIFWGPDDHIWFTERQGTVSRINPATGQRNIILTITDIIETGESGLLGLTLHPEFPDEPFVYLVYTYPQGSTIKEKLVRYTWNGSYLENPFILIENINGNTNHNGSRLAFGPDGKLYMSTGDAWTTGYAQNLNYLNGKILRINDDGSIPDDNPFPGKFIWSYGLRNSQGLVFSPAGILYGSEHGPNTDDELNILEAGRNYGWPAVNGYCDLPEEISFCNENNVSEPIAAWTPTLAVAGIDYYNHSDIPEWQNSILMTTLKAGRLVSLKLSADGLSVIEQADWLVSHYGRLRDICVSPDGRVFLAVSNRDGRGTPRPGDDRIVEIKAAGTIGLLDKPKKNNHLKIVPNPVNSETIVQIGESHTGSEFRIVNTTGQLILSGKVGQKQFKLETGNLKPGYYFLHVSGDAGQVSAPFVVM